MLTHIYSQNMRFIFRIFFNVCTTAQQFVGTNVRISKEMGSGKFKGIWSYPYIKIREAGNSLARLTSRCILLVGENNSFVVSLYIYIYIFIQL